MRTESWDKPYKPVPGLWAWIKCFSRPQLSHPTSCSQMFNLPFGWNINSFPFCLLLLTQIWSLHPLTPHEVWPAWLAFPLGPCPVIHAPSLIPSVASECWLTSILVAGYLHMSLINSWSQFWGARIFPIGSKYIHLHCISWLSHFFHTAAISPLTLLKGLPEIEF